MNEQKLNMKYGTGLTNKLTHKCEKKNYTPAIYLKTPRQLTVDKHAENIVFHKYYLHPSHQFIPCHDET